MVNVKCSDNGVLVGVWRSLHRWTQQFEKYIIFSKYVYFLMYNFDFSTWEMWFLWKKNAQSDPHLTCIQSKSYWICTQSKSYLTCAQSKPHDPKQKYKIYNLFFQHEIHSCVNVEKEKCQPKLGFEYIWIYAWILDSSNCQYSVHKITTVHKHGGWRTWNKNIQSCGCCVAVFFFIVVWCFCPHKCTSLNIFGQVVCPNKLNP